MNIFHSLLYGDSTAHTVFVLAFIIAAGVLIGKIKILKVGIGITGVLFAGLFFGHFRMGFDEKTLDFIREFGLILFVYTIGIQIGPAFFASFRKQGLRLNILAAVIVGLGFATASAILLITGLPAQIVVGTMSGAVTNTPGLGAAQQVIGDALGKASDAVQLTGVAYALSYPFAIFGIILAIIFFRKIFKIDIGHEIKDFKERQNEILSAPSNFNLMVTNSKIEGTTIDELHKLIKQDFAISRLCRDGKISLPAGTEALRTGDIIHVVCSKETAEDLALVTGDISETDIRTIKSELDSKSVMVTSKSAVNSSIAELDFGNRFSAGFTRVFRAGIELVARPSLKLQFGDRVTLVGYADQLEDAAKELGDSAKDLEHPNILPIFLGIIAGLILGSIPARIPGFALPVKLGLSGGTLLAAIILGRIGQVGSLNWFMPHGANLILRETGITMFLACVGLRAGDKFLETLLNGQGLYWILLGLLITLLPLIIVGFAGRLLFKMNYLSLCGLLSGSLTDPPALSYANQMTSSDAPNITYATVYALTMFLRIMAAQLFVIMFL